MDETMLLWGLGLLAASLLLVIVEVFVPSGGLIAVTAIGCALAGIYCLFTFSTTWGLAGLGAMVVMVPITASFALKVWPHTPIGRKMLGRLPPEVIEAQQEEARRERERLAAMLGAEGVALTDLRPVGVVEIEGRRFDALAEAGMIRARQRVRVTHVEPSQIKVRAIG